MHKCAYMSTLCIRTQVACPLSTGITPGFCVCGCPSCEALGCRGDPQCRQCGGRAELGAGVATSAKYGTTAPGDCQEEPSRSSVELMRWVSNTNVPTQSC